MARAESGPKVTRKSPESSRLSLCGKDGGAGIIFVMTMSDSHLSFLTFQNIGSAALVIESRLGKGVRREYGGTGQKLRVNRLPEELNDEVTVSLNEAIQFAVRHVILHTTNQGKPCQIVLSIR